MAWAAIIPALIGAGSSAYAASQQASGPGRPRTERVPLPPYLQALQRFNANLLARSEMAQPPSFGQWLASGGTATFPMATPEMTPQEAYNLGMVGPRGQAIPYIDPNMAGGTLTPEQQLYLGYQQSRGGAPGSPLARAFRINQRLGRMLQRPQTPGRERREERLRTRRGRLMNPPSGGGGQLF